MIGAVGYLWYRNKAKKSKNKVKGIESMSKKTNQNLELSFRHLWANRHNDGLQVEFDSSWLIGDSYNGAVFTEPKLDDGVYAFCESPTNDLILLVGCGDGNIVLWMNGQGVIRYSCPDQDICDDLVFVTEVLSTASEIIEEINERSVEHSEAA